MEGFLGFRAGRWDAAVLAAFGKAARRAPRPRGRGGARHPTQLGHAKRGNPVTVRQERRPAGRQQRGTRGGTGRLRKRTAAAERRQLKHSTVRADQPWTKSGLKKSLEGFARRFSALGDTSPGLRDRVTFEFVSNRPVDDAVNQALN